MAPKRSTRNRKNGVEETNTKNVSDKSKIIKRKNVPTNNTYSLYVQELLKDIHPDIGISNKAVNTIDSFVNDILDQIATEASRIAKENKKTTISNKDIQAAMKLVLPAEIAKYLNGDEEKSDEEK